MERIYIEYLGLAAGTLTTAAYLPQVWKTWRTKAVEHISLVMYTSMSLGVLLWTVYGVLIKAPAVIMANSLCLILVVSMLRMKIIYGRRAKAAKIAAGQNTPGQTAPEQTASAQATPDENSTVQNASCRAPGPSLATQLGRGLRQLKDKHHKTWGKN